MSVSAATSSVAAAGVAERVRVTIRFAGDSGDGMQLAGQRFTDATAVAGNDFATMPDYPAEIRAPGGTVHGVSSFQIQFASEDTLTPGDAPDVLVAMNPAALRANLPDAQPGAIVLVNEDGFTKRAVAKAGYASDPLDDGSLDGYVLHRVAMTSLTRRAVAGVEGVDPRIAARAKNLFALGLVAWLFDRPPAVIEGWLERRFAAAPETLDANLTAFAAGWSFGEAAELPLAQRRIARARSREPGTYRHLNGSQALALGLIAAAWKSGLGLLLASYPITPASELLHELARHRKHGVRTVQAEDEIAAANMALGASYGGYLGVTATSGPGMDLKMETIGLAVSLELPLVVIDVQRAGPSTGMPTKTEQSDLLMAIHGRHGESPLPVLASGTPGGCFRGAYDAVRIAVTYRTPVVLLVDLSLVMSSEPWRVVRPDGLAPIEPRHEPPSDAKFEPYARDHRGARPWAIPGTPGLQHRIGGLEKADGGGEISYDAANHATMTRLRAAKVRSVADELAPLAVDDHGGAELLVVGWGSTYGAITEGVRRVRAAGGRVAACHLELLCPLPRNTGEVLRRYRRVLCVEVNAGQLVHLLRAELLVDIESYGTGGGQPLTVAEVEREIRARSES